MINGEHKLPSSKRSIFEVIYLIISLENCKKKVIAIILIFHSLLRIIKKLPKLFFCLLEIKILNCTKNYHQQLSINFSNITFLPFYAFFWREGYERKEKRIANKLRVANVSRIFSTPTKATINLLRLSYMLDELITDVDTMLNKL